MEVVAWESRDSLTFAKARHYAIYFDSVKSLDDSTQHLRIRNRDMNTVVNAFILSCFGIDM